MLAIVDLCKPEGVVDKKIDVETGIGLGVFVEIIGNVDQGDRIITRGGERIQPGQAVTIADS